MTTPRLRSNVTMKGSDELGATGMVFHGAGIGFRIGQYLAFVVDDRGPRSSGKARLRSNFWKTVQPVGFNSLGKQRGLLREITLDLRRERGFPCPSDRDIERNRGGDDHDYESCHQLYKDSAPHLGTSKRYPAPRTVFR